MKTVGKMLFQVPTQQAVSCSRRIIRGARARRNCGLNAVAALGL